MIFFKKIDIHLYHQQRQRLKKLYLEAFTEGISAQHIDEKDAETYLDQCFSKGYGISGFSEDKLIAALISIPPSFDTQRPKAIQTKFNDDDTEYIAEVLVDKKFRGQGLGKKLIQFYEDNLIKATNHVLLRVWDKNEAAVGLYKKFGFKKCGSVIQKKLKPISKESFEMHKIYMQKSY